MAQKLPLGLQDFREIISGGYKYIDKTRYIYEMCSTGKYYFMSRPRRFGKSMTVSTLYELYSGSRELFKGLWIEDRWDWEKRNPVLRFNFTGIGFAKIGLDAALDQKLDELIKDFDLPASQAIPSLKFEYLIKNCAKAGKVVVLIDEYDAPITHYLANDLDTAKANRDILRDFFVVLKNNDGLLELVFLTGISRFSRVGVFSGLNNLTDLSMDIEFAAMLGYTQEELESHFVEEIELTAQKMQLPIPDLLQEIRRWYNGYRFHADAETVYNPYSINLFFKHKEFRSFWFQTGTPLFLINLLQQEGLYDVRPTLQSEESFDTFSPDAINPYGLLFQTGYLTIHARKAFGLYELDYPNYEVEHSMTRNLFETIVGKQNGEAVPLVYKLETLLEKRQVDQVIKQLQGLFKNVPYQLHEQYPEKFFHAVVHLLFNYMGLTVKSEVCTSDGRIDAVVETPSWIYMIEFKLDESVETALAQIHKKEYYQAYWLKDKPILGLGINFSSESKNISDWKLEEMP
jgi:hypothetical protein